MKNRKKMTLYAGDKTVDFNELKELKSNYELTNNRNEADIILEGSTIRFKTGATVECRHWLEKGISLANIINIVSKDLYALNKVRHN
ncbi:MAG: hypothetical protein ACLS2V_12610 [Clostridium paraputrificum]|uniref:hypothetical protein n=1 Tax=Clostridium sp. TaxID=1506 RepID=UPI0025C12725|nr:hypothetical protein [Clostridium sp.]MBS5926157.1 hypothetical protein [Clostridium sp.]